MGGSLILGGFAALVAVSIYLFVRNKEDKDSRRIYGFFMLFGVGSFLGLFEVIGVDSYMLARGVYAVLFIVICLLGK